LTDPTARSRSTPVAVAEVAVSRQRPTGVEALVPIVLDPLADRERNRFDPRITTERLLRDVGENDAVLSAGEADEPRRGVSGEAGRRSFFRIRRRTRFYLLAEVVVSKVPGVRRVHHRLAATPITVHHLVLPGGRYHGFVGQSFCPPGSKHA
jgi:hypothetical protein